ncbi:hypothetical protein CEXT_298411 [Caerostris extrusa]|uniref:Uncharacterized protein n=1 Tax=Caerostris extrusa TaxID=172846 RepID=A0AAV4U7P3_CAEEX|nr:hypothetical protein CEXT_298411 [Caerostris extrusa]
MARDSEARGRDNVRRCLARKQLKRRAPAEKRTSAALRTRLSRHQTQAPAVANQERLRSPCSTGSSSSLCCEVRQRVIFMLHWRKKKNIFYWERDLDIKV